MSHHGHEYRDECPHCGDYMPCTRATCRGKARKKEAMAMNQFDGPETDRQLVAHALNMRRNMIETGDPLLSAADAASQGKRDIIKVLGIEQMKLIVRIDELARMAGNGTLRL